MKHCITATAGPQRRRRALALATALLLFLGSACAPAHRYHLRTSGTSVRTGLELFLKKHARRYTGKKAALVTNHSGVDFSLRHNTALLREKGIAVTILIAPEHGIHGYENDIDGRTVSFDQGHRTVIYNLMQVTVPQLRQLFRGVDIVIFDIQDMGMRCYTYVSNLTAVMDALAGLPQELIVLDRPNPVGFLGVDGADLDPAFRTPFVSAFPAPFLYDMTMGEAARYYRGERTPTVKLRVIPMRGYRRMASFPETGLPWVPPSPNLPAYESAVVYTGMVLLEGINISLGRGTTKPFEYIGAPWIEPVAFCRGLEGLGLANFRFRPVYFKPTFSKYAGMSCGGAQVFYLGGGFSPTELAYRIIAYVLKQYPPARWEQYRWWFDIDSLAGTDRLRKSIMEGMIWSEFRDSIAAERKAYLKKRKKYLIY